MELKDIINYVIKSCKESDLSPLVNVSLLPDKNMILDCAVRIYNSQSFKGKEKEQPSGKEVVKETKSVKVPASDKQKYALINYYGYTEEEVDEMDCQLAYDTIKKEKEIEQKEREKKK